WTRVGPFYPMGDHYQQGKSREEWSQGPNKRFDIFGIHPNEISNLEILFGENSYGLADKCRKCSKGDRTKLGKDEAPNFSNTGPELLNLFEIHSHEVLCTFIIKRWKSIFFDTPVAKKA
ncbi:7858_t:CDS:2, partial [Racocetra persica]